MVIIMASDEMIWELIKELKEQNKILKKYLKKQNETHQEIEILLTEILDRK